MVSLQMQEHMNASFLCVLCQYHSNRQVSSSVVLAYKFSPSLFPSPVEFQILLKM